MKTTTNVEPSPYMSAKEIALLFGCANSSIGRIAGRERFTRLCLGTGKRGMVRYLRSDVEKFVSKRLYKPAAR
jgi:hypothetical protein